MRTLLLISLCWIGLAAASFGQDELPVGADANRRVAEAQRRDWVRKQLGKLISDQKQLAEVHSRLHDLSDDQIQAVANLCLDELEARRKQQFQLLREANARERAFQEHLARQVPFQPGFYSPSVGFIPVISWLP